jgi:nucleoside-diphosphate-sugar epimerase
VVGRDLPVKAFPWWLAVLASPFVETLREVLEMRYLWNQPLRLDNAKLVSVIGPEPHTPLDQAVKTALIDLKCL